MSAHASTRALPAAALVVEAAATPRSVATHACRLRSPQLFSERKASTFTVEAQQKTVSKIVLVVAALGSPVLYRRDVVAAFEHDDQPRALEQSSDTR